MMQNQYRNYKSSKVSFTFLVLLSIYSAMTFSQIIDNSKGIDQNVNYHSLMKFGPWDDRNYNLTTLDLTWLSQNEENLTEMVPAFYRVLFRKTYPNTPTTGKYQYPRSLYNYFKQRYDGYLIDGVIYTDVKWDYINHNYQIIINNGKTPGQIIRNRVNALNTDILVAAGAESAIAISPVNPKLVVAGINFTGQKMFHSTDSGQTWSLASELTGSECCDPAVEWSADGTYAYALTLGGGQVWFYRSDDAGVSWDSLFDETPGDNRREIIGTIGGALNDKEYIHVDKSLNSPFKDNVYITWHQANVLHFATSLDNGNTFSINTFSNEPKGIGSDVVTDELGTIYHFWPAHLASQIRMNKSVDGGRNFSPSVLVAQTNASFIFPIPSMDTRNVFIYTSVDIDLSQGPYHGRLYAAWTDTVEIQSDDPLSNHARIQVAYSQDSGQTWHTSTPHETHDFLNVDRWHQWLKVDKDGIVHVVYYDTREFPNRDGVDFYHSFSNNGGVSWSAPERMTNQSSPKSTGFQFGDYNGMDIGFDGNGIAIFSDNRAEGGNAPDMDVYIAPIIYKNRFDDKIYHNGFESDLIFANGFE